MKRHGVCMALLPCFLICAISTLADSEGEQSKGVTFYENFQGSANAAGLVTKLDTKAGYNFNKYAGLDFGVPFYFINPSRVKLRGHGKRFYDRTGKSPFSTA